MKFVFAVVALFFLAGCTHTEVVPTAKLYEKPEFVAPAVPSIALSPLHWNVVSPENICLAPEDFKALMSNEKTTRDAISKLNSVIDAYKQYYKPHETEAHP